eukprot:TRINITY_DN4370_c0_g1_i1.p1 TRINITY_DN4370_c0_g1~~TRINITY_DN4370_c0_g1_i1.p1  ORF type:complete len:321 (+),score=62.23 TRINITY_DN4370_c0_g1_i1:156-1118(+)
MVTPSKKIGQGGFGAVYIGTWGGTLVAIKELLAAGSGSGSGSGSGGSEERAAAFLEFQREAFTMSSLFHPNLVRLYGVTSSPPYMVMEFASLGDVSHFLHPDKDIDMAQEDCPIGVRTSLALTAAKGMLFLHSLHPPLIHRDLRSANVFIFVDSNSPFPVAKIADFGMSRRAGTEMGNALPNWEWLAPEIWDTISDTHTEYDHRSDVYSFGLLLWEFATIKVPYRDFFLSDKYSKKTGINKDGTAIRVPKTNLLRQDIVLGLRPERVEGFPEPGQHGNSYAGLIDCCLLKDPRQRPLFSALVPALATIHTRVVELTMAAM